MTVDRPLRVAILGLKGLPASGGGARAGESVLTRLGQGQEIEFVVYALSSYASETDPLPGVKQVIIPGFPLRGLSLVWYYLAGAGLIRRDGRFDVVHLQHGMGGIVAPLLARRSPLMLTLRGSAANLGKDSRFGGLALRILAFCERLGLKHCDEVVTVAKPHVDHYARLGRPGVRWIPNGVDFETNGHNVEATTRHREPYIAFAAARIIPLKGLHLLIDAIRRADLKVPLKVAGDLGIDPEYERTIRSMTESVDIEFLGLERDKARLLEFVRAATVFVFPSTTEAMSNMLLEATSVGTPVVCSDIAENRAILADDEVAFFQSGSSAALERSLMWVLDNPTEARERAHRAYVRLRKEFNWDTISSAYRDLYVQLASRKSR